MRDKGINLTQVRRYFSDLRKWTAAAAVLLVTAYLAVAMNSRLIWGRYILIPICFIILFAVNSKYYLLFLKAVKDIRRNEITEEIIVADSVKWDKRFTFFNNGGAQVGDMHLLLEDTNGNGYRLYRKKWMLPTTDDFVGAPAKIRYLNTSRIVVSMAALQAKKNDQSAQRAAAKLQTELNDYFTV